MTVKLRTIIILLMLGLAAGVGMVYVGVYDIAATRQHTGPVYLLLDYAMRKSVKQRAESIQVPNLSSEQRLRNGLALYRAHCLQCHGAPGVAPEPFSFGMRPAPANLAATAREWPSAELYWVIRYGIKMSGMPGWQYRLSDQEIWDVVAFAERMASLSPMQYQEWSAQIPPHTAQQRAKAALNPSYQGDVAAGKQALQQYLCATCHRIPGIVGANQHVGPPLDGIGKRKYIGGVVPNTPENMVRWLLDPKQIDPLSAMPNLHVTEKDARDIAAFLYTLEDID